MNYYSWRTRRTDDEPTQECTCPHCNLKVAGEKHLIISSGGYQRYFVLECPSCGKPIIYTFPDGQTYPFAKKLRSVKHLSEAIAAVYDEVNGAIAAGCYTAAVILARTAIMHVAVEHGAEDNKNFQYYVNYLVTKGFVPPNANAWIDAIRKMANKSVHELEIWKKEDAEKIGTFLMYLLVFVYELPASV